MDDGDTKTKAKKWAVYSGDAGVFEKVLGKERKLADPPKLTTLSCYSLCDLAAAPPSCLIKKHIRICFFFTYMFFF